MGFRPLLCVAFMVAPASGIRAQIAPSVLTEAEAVAIARGANRDMQHASLDRVRGAAAIRQARTNYFPQTDIRLISGAPLQPLALTIPLGALGVYPTIGPIPGKNMDIKSGGRSEAATFATVAQPLSQLYKAHLGIQSARLQEQLATEAERGERQKTIAQVKQIYREIAGAQAAVASDAEQLRSLEEALRTTRNNVQQGAALRAEELQVEAALAQQRVAALHDRDYLTTQREEMNRLLARDLDIEFSVEPVGSPEPSQTDLARARNLALQQRPEIRQAELQMKKAELDIRRERADYIPDVSIQLTYLGLANVQFLSSNTVTAGFSVEWRNPWDWGRRRAAVSALKDVAKQRRLTADDARQQILLDVDQRFRVLDEARLAVEAAEAARDASAEKLRNITNQYREQAALLQDVLKQNAELQRRTSSYTEALARYWTARADFERAIGEE